MGASEPDANNPPPTAFVAWKRIFELSPMPMALLLDEDFAFANQAFCNLLTLTAEEIIGLHYTGVLADGFGTEANATPIPEDAVAAGGLHLEGPVTLPDGTERYLALDAKIVPSLADEPTLTIVQIADLSELNAARLEIARSENRVRSLLANIGDVITVFDADFGILFTAGAGVIDVFEPASRWSSDPFERIHPDDLAEVTLRWADLLANPGATRDIQIRLRTPDGHWAYVAANAVNLLDDPDVGGIVTTASDITALRRAELLATSQAHVLELIASGAPLRDVYDACVDIVAANGTGGTTALFLLDDGRLERWAGQGPPEIADHLRDPARPPGRSISDQAILTCSLVIVPDALADPELAPLAARAGVGSGWSVPILAVNTGEALGALSTVHVEPHSPTDHERQAAEVASHLVALALDRARTEERLAHLALHDPLTNLPNRTLLLDRLEQALTRRRLTGQGVAVLFCDLDRFKVVNDSLGHGVGDGLLRAFAARVERAVRPSDTVARFGGDEFVVLLDPVVDADEPQQVAERIARTLDEPFVVEDREVYLTVSIGLATASDDTTGDAWLRDADAAMYQAKELGRDRVEAFDTEMRAAALARLQIESDLRRAVDRGELVVYFQPTVDLDAGRIRGAEALARWQHPRYGLILPDDFIPVAEDLGIIGAIDQQILELALREAPRFAEKCREGRFELSVNVSGRHLVSGLDERVRAACDRHGWDRSDLVLEVTETALGLDLDGPLDVLRRVSQLGVRIAIDDFGTGYSSLTRLGQLPVDRVKIDRAFVLGIHRGDERLMRIVDAVIAIADALGLSVAAEGVETSAQVEYLRRIGCQTAQGYLFAKPLATSDFEELLAADPRW